VSEPFTGVLVYEQGILVLVDPFDQADEERITEEGDLRLLESGETRIVQ
jgi:hypothetical protein